MTLNKTNLAKSALLIVAVSVIWGIVSWAISFDSPTWLNFLIGGSVGFFCAAKWPFLD